MCNKHFNKPAKNQTLSRAFPEFMVKKRSRGQPRQGSHGDNSDGDNSMSYLGNFSFRTVTVKLFPGKPKPLLIYDCANTVILINT